MCHGVQLVGGLGGCVLILGFRDRRVKVGGSARIPTMSYLKSIYTSNAPIGLDED